MIRMKDRRRAHPAFVNRPGASRRRSVAPWTGRPSGVSSLPGRVGDTPRCAGRPYGGARPSSVWLSAILSRIPAISGASTFLKTTE